MPLPFTLERSLVVDQSAEQVYALISDFNTWRSWSPWLSQEPDCPVEIKGTPGQLGHGQAWEGKKIGSGHMELVEAEPGRLLRYELFFLKPWKSQSQTAFTLAAEGSGTRITWSMDGSIPVLMIFWRKSMAKQVGADYERGLAMMAERLKEVG